MKNIFTLLLMSFACTVFAGDFKLGKVSKEELEEKVHPLDPSAKAAVLYKKGKTYFDIDNERWVIFTEVEVRVKIYSKEGYDWANVAVPYYYKRVSGESVTFKEAATYNLVNGEIQKTSLNKDEEFTEELSKTRRQKKIMLPNVKEGSVIEYKYIVKSPYIYNLEDWFFQDKIPVNYVQYNLNIPQFFSYNRIINSYYPIEEKTDIVKRTIIDRHAKITLHEIAQEYVVKDLPAFKTEAYIDNIDNYLLFVKHELSETRDMNDKVTKFASNWESVAKVLYMEDDFGDELKKTAYFKTDIDALLSGVTDDRKKMETVFNYVKNRMSWSGRYGLTSWESVKKAYDERSGNSGEINLMLTAMLKYAGLKASPVIISTRDNGIASYISVYAFNYVIAGVEFGDEVVLLDATSKYAEPGLLPVNDLNGYGRLLREDKTDKEVKLNPTVNSRESVYLTAQINTDGIVTGKTSNRYYDYNAIRYREKYADINEEQHIEQAEKKRGNVEISDFEFKDAKETEVNFSFTAKGAEVIGDKIYVSPLLFYAETENPFKEEKRLHILQQEGLLLYLQFLKAMR
ncbi:DUF3857 domain-containing protein [Flavobacterium alkalisoli]|uniref:DUF3857 domain-containing protein n=1 Tax=Flavobacterium alkalisoli TaxID=2602769 RepID=A0A5B9FSY6_9FLAO|nr:DUF3857 domain-containing protein [Flavobacterium alkalisoli]QEE49286.1 DUF3857 domain-containing protein [Flavobacterium alkalisoli]